ncbi:MAG: glycosyltransferase [Acidobacteria bacterium]|nr:glycosyltransferase [Acidobacteriota bacterium]
MALLSCPQGPLTITRGEPSSIQLSLILPTYNERKNIKRIIEVLSGILDPVLPNAYELIVVDDDSPDRTWEIAEALAAEFPQVRVLRRQNERGLATAVIRGWQCARGTVIGVIDADLQHPPEVMTALWDRMCNGADLAVGSRHVDGGGVGDWGIVRRTLSRSAQMLGLMILPDVLGRLSDPMSGCFLLRRSAIENRKLNPHGYKILIEVVGRGQVGRISEVGYVFRERAEGESKVSWRLYVDYIRHLIGLRAATLPTAQFMQFATVGFSGVFVDMGLLYLLSDPSTLAWGLTTSKLLAGEGAILNNFYWNDVWTFRHAVQGRTSWPQKLKRFLTFNGICGTGVLFAAALLNIQVTYFGMNRYIANAVAIGIVTLWNFWLNKQLAWAIRPAPVSSSISALEESPESRKAA